MGGDSSEVASRGWANYDLLQASPLGCLTSSATKQVWLCFLGTHVHFPQACCLAAQRAQVEQFGATHVRRTHDLDLVDDLRVEGEDTFHSVSEAHLAHDEARLRAPAFGDDQALKHLYSLLVAFLDLHVHANGVARLEIGMIGAP